MKSILSIVIGISIFLTGCASTQSYRKVTDNEIPKHNEVISDYQSGEYLGHWVQPVNKTVKCEMLMESYPLNDQRQWSLDNPSEVEWDGSCKDGKAVGLGKISSTNGSINYYEVSYHNKGVTDQLFYKWTEGTNQIQFGSYIHENHKMTKLLTNSANITPNGEIESVYSMLEENIITGVHKGVGFREYSDGFAKYTGESGDLLFFGSRESFDIDNKPTFAFGGYYDIGADKPDNYVVLKNGQGLWHQKYQYGSVQEHVELPQSYINSIMEVTNEAAKVANKVSRAGQLALAMKKKYDAQQSLSPSGAEQPKKPNPEYSKGISTGTGFFISNDGYILTNSHVIEGSSNISIILNGKSVPAILVDHDRSNDIALLKINESVEGLPIELKKKTKQGAEISVLGYPNIGLQGNEQKATFGFINANSGIQGDTRYFQISSPIQPGNSGSPMINEQGVVIGIASASLNQTAAIKATGTLAQNVNYAVKIPYALPMLISHGVEYIEPSSKKFFEKTELIENIADSVVLVVAE